MNELRQLIVNADDYGVTKNVSLGIREAHQQGIVTTTTAIMIAPAVTQELALAQELCPKLAVGVHLVLTAGPPIRPASTVPSLVGSDGRFHEFKDISLSEFNLDHVYDEWRAQIDTFLETGIPLSHLDSHYHISYLNEGIFEVMLRLASMYAAPVRFPPETAYHEKYHPVELLKKYDVGHPDRLITSFHKEGTTREHMIEILQSLPPGTSEIMCHPGYSDQELEAMGSYSRIREQELAALRNLGVVSAIDEYDITLTTFSALGCS
jgi:predicted glycoside hydrolase/deacetylase ChbG (UPF0249 family)